MTFLRQPILFQKNLPNTVTVTGITVGTDATAVTVDYQGGGSDDLDISTYFGNATITYKSGATGATWNGTSWTLTKATP